MANPTSPVAPSDSLTVAIADTRGDISSIEAGIQELTNSIPETNSILSNRPEVNGIMVQLRMDREYLTLRQADLLRLERTQRARGRAA